MADIDELIKGWQWRYNVGAKCLELYDRNEMLAFIKTRPTYCDRGHFQVCIEKGGLNLEDNDGRDYMYFMDLEVAMWETVEWLVWRMHKASHHTCGSNAITEWAAEEMPLGMMDITSIKHRGTSAPTPESFAPHIEHRNGGK